MLHPVLQHPSEPQLPVTLCFGELQCRGSDLETSSPGTEQSHVKGCCSPRSALLQPGILRIHQKLMPGRWNPTCLHPLGTVLGTRSREETTSSEMSLPPLLLCHPYRSSALALTYLNSQNQKKNNPGKGKQHTGRAARQSSSAKAPALSCRRCSCQ